ncbi:MAG: 50S ribosomal protein P1 [Candidatus Diapherotrites archaeon]|nr:50S ribosomal protein P1 [Candidatus Diapherotrites archaeon]
MEYIYAALLLHSAGKEITEDAVMSVLKSAGVAADAARVKALIASLKEVNIDEAIKSAALMQAAPMQTAQAAGHAATKKEEKAVEEEKKTEEEAVSGLSSLFG